MADVQLHTMQEVADILGLSYRKVRQLRSDGELRSVRIGGAVRIRSDDLREFIDDRTFESARRVVL